MRLMTSTRMLAPHLALRISPAKYLGAKQLSLQRRCGFCAHRVQAGSKQPRFLQDNPQKYQSLL